MDKRLQDIADNLDKMKVGLDDTFKFNCTMCGKCCINRDDILLTPKDLFKMSKKLDMSTKGFIDKYCDYYVGDSSRIPIVRLKPVGYMNRCPLLNGNRCSVHDVKPVVCAMFPIGRCLVLDPKKECDFTTDDIIYINQNPGCGDKRKTHMVREWLELSKVPIDDEFFIAWHRTIAQIGNTICEEEKNNSEKRMNDMWSGLFMLLYILYDTSKDFMEQFKMNAMFAFKLVSALKEGK